MDLGGGGMNLGTAQSPKRKPGTFTYDDKVSMSDSLSAIGLTCAANSPDKMGGYIEKIHRDISSANSSVGQTANMGSADSDCHDYIFKIQDTNKYYSKMMVIVSHFDKIESEGLYPIDKHHVTRNFDSSTVAAITSAMNNIGRIIGTISCGNVSTDQITSYMGQFIKTLTVKSSNDFHKKDDGNWFIFVPPINKCPAFGGVHFHFEMNISDYKSKKHHTHTACYEVTQRNITFTELSEFYRVLNAVQ